MSLSSPERLAECRTLGWDDGRGGHVRGEVVAALLEYAERGVPLGEFLQAVLSNDLMEASARADADNRANLAALASFVWNEMPSPCWGSHRIYDVWIDLKAQERIARLAAERVPVPTNWPPPQGEPHVQDPDAPE